MLNTQHMSNRVGPPLGILEPVFCLKTNNHIPVIICGQVIDFQCPESKNANCSRWGILWATTMPRRTFSHFTPRARFMVTTQWLSTWQVLKSPMRQEITHRATLVRVFFAFWLTEMGRATPDVCRPFSGGLNITKSEVEKARPSSCPSLPQESLSPLQILSSHALRVLQYGLLNSPPSGSLCRLQAVTPAVPKTIHTQRGSVLPAAHNYHYNSKIFLYCWW